MSLAECLNEPEEDVTLTAIRQKSIEKPFAEVVYKVEKVERITKQSVTKTTSTK